MSVAIAPLIRRYLRLGADPDDRESVQLAKVQLMGSASIGILGAFILSSIYLSFQEPEAGLVAIGCGILMTVNIAGFVLLHHNLEIAFTVQAVLALLAALMWVFALGGFANSSGTVLYGLVFVLMGGRYSRFWLLIFVLCLVAAIFVHPYPRESINLPPFVVSLLWLINLSLLSGVLLVMYRYAVAQRNNAYRLLRGEQERAESLLLSILPREIAAVLKKQPRTIAEHFDGASILFADVVSFTPMSAEMAPVEMVELLNEIFSHFDELVEKYDLEKIKTIGDCYMAAAGVPRARPDHAQALTRMALDIQAYIAAREFRQHKLAFRIGINSGAVVAGVIGRKKFSYDLWGDTVNTASRMESQGLGGTIQITRATYELIKDEFACEPRGTIDVKGKGPMETWHVTGAKHNVANAA